MLSPLLLAFGFNAAADKAAWSPIVLGYEPPNREGYLELGRYENDHRK